MKNRNHLRKIAYISLSLLISFSFFTPVSNALKATESACQNKCNEGNLKGVGRNANKLQTCTDKCVKAANEAKAQSM